MKLDNEIVIDWEPHMMRYVGPRAKMLVFGTKYGMVVVTNRRFLFLSEGESGLAASSREMSKRSIASILTRKAP